MSAPNLPHLTGTCAETLLMRYGFFGTRSVYEAWTASLARIAVESELRHNEHFAADVCDAHVHFAVGILKYAQLGKLLSDVIGVGRSIFIAYAEKNHKPLLNGA